MGRGVTGIKEGERGINSLSEVLEGRAFPKMQNGSLGPLTMTAEALVLSIVTLGLLGVRPVGLYLHALKGGLLLYA